MLRSLRSLAQLFSIAAVIGLMGLSAAAAQEEQPAPRLEITGVNTDAFPLIQLKVISTDGSGNRISMPGDVQIVEDDLVVSGFEEASDVVGTEVIFVIDANRTIASRDDSSARSRLEKVRESIVLFASQYMNQSQKDRVSIVVPDGDQVRFLLEDAIFPNEVINEINFYEPSQLGETPLNEMMLEAIDKAADTRSEGRFQAILLYSDAGSIGDQLDYPTLVSRAQELDLPIFGAILGAQADSNEVANMQGVTIPTRGNQVHMPQSGDSEPVLALFQENAEQHILEYRSQLNSSGTHTISLESGDARDSYELTLDIAPPGISMALDNSAPIVRVAESYDSELTAANPTSQPVAARIEWPDGHPRSIAEASLVVDGVVSQTINGPESTDDGLVSFQWDISNLGDGVFELVITAVDDLGLVGESAPLPVTIAVDRPEPPPPTEEIPQEVVEETEPEEAPDSGGLMNNIGTLGIVIGVLALVFAVALVIFAIFLVRRRQVRPAAAGPYGTAGSQAAAMDHDATQVIRPAFIAKQLATAYLEPLENTSEHQGNIPLAEENVSIGRDPKLADIVFGDKSVSRLHARIIKKGSSFQLYDEGSASGTYLNYEQLSLEPQPLRDNDDIHIGRVHVRFRLSAPVVDEDDATQVMQAPPSRQPAAAQASPVDEDTSTKPYMPYTPQDSPQQGPAQEAGGDEDDVSTQPYMPHSPKR